MNRPSRSDVQSLFQSLIPEEGITYKPEVSVWIQSDIVWVTDFVSNHRNDPDLKLSLQDLILIFVHPVIRLVNFTKF